MTNFFLQITNPFASLPVTVQIVIFVLILAVVLTAVFFIGRFAGRVQTELKLKDQIKDSRNDAVKRSRAVITGQMAEQVAPFLPDFPCNPQEVRFVGKPVDFIGFSGTADSDEVQEILFIEVKTGSSQLSSRERQIKKAVEEKRVRYVEYRIP